MEQQQQELSEQMTTYMIHSDTGGIAFLQYLRTHDCTVPIRQRLTEADDEPNKRRLITVFQRATRLNHEEIVTLLLQYKMDVEARTQGGWTALIVASYEGHENLVQLFLDNNANVNAVEEGGNSSLMCASANGFASIVKLLLENHADRDLENCDEDTALSRAGNDEIRDMLENYFSTTYILK